MDLREASAIARSLARFPLQAAFRYNRRATDAPKLQLEWTQFPDARVLSALAERATITTLMNVEGKSLTEVILRVRNHAQQFVKVELPAGASLVTAEVEGQRVKLVSGPDGSRVPLTRTGFTPSGAYTVSFVYFNPGTRFAKSGSYDMGLPKLDIPINLLTWEVSLPDRLEVKQFGGNAIAAELFPAAAQNVLAVNLEGMGTETVWRLDGGDLDTLEGGQIGGIVVDPAGAIVANATVNVTNTQTGVTLNTRTDGDGMWKVFGMQPGPVRVLIASPGFSNVQVELELSASKPARMGTTLPVASVTETVQITDGGGISDGRDSRKLEEQARKQREAQMTAPSANVLSLQRRVAGILPVRIDVPRAGKSYRFVRPLVLEEETTVTFQYKSK